MAEYVLKCDQCKNDIPVEPLTTFSYRMVSCFNCGADLPFQNTELRMRGSSNGGREETR